MPGIDGLELLRRTIDLPTRFVVVMITGHADVPIAVQAMKIGAADFIEKPFSDDTILGGVSRALTRLDRVLSAADSAVAARERLGVLTEREKEIFASMVAGLTNKLMAGRFGISVRTVEVHRFRIMTKMEAASLSQLVQLAITAGIPIAP
jgi:two-component system response regulator FixJ